MSMQYIRQTYNVPAKIGGRVEYTGRESPILGTIKGASGGHLSILLDGDRCAKNFHPTWELRYLDSPTAPANTAQAATKGIAE